MQDKEEIVVVLLMQGRELKMVMLCKLKGLLSGDSLISGLWQVRNKDGMLMFIVDEMKL